MARSPSIHTNNSQYTLATVHDGDAATDIDDDDEHASLLPSFARNRASYGSTPLAPAAPHNSRRLIFNAALKMGLIFFFSTAILGGVLWLALPTLDESVRSPLLH